MQLRPSPETFLTEPHDGYVIGAHYVAWCYRDELLGSVVWGSPEADELRFLLSLWQLDARMKQGFEAVSDVLLLEGLPLEGFGEIALAYDRAGQLRHLRRHAVVCAPHLASTMRQVFFPRFPVRHEEQVFSDSAAAFAWLKHRDAARVGATIAALVRAARGTVADGAPTALGSNTRAELAGYCRAHLRDATLAGAAAAVGRPARTLQRELTQLGTSFRDVLTEARIAEAQRLLTTTTLSLATIAQEIGCASASHLSSLYRKMTGTRPSDARTKR